MNEELYKILEDEDFLDERQGVANIGNLQMQKNHRKLFAQIVYEIRKGSIIDFEFMDNIKGHSEPAKDISYQPLRKIGETSWYEGQWSNILGHQIGYGLLLIIDT